MTPNRRLDAYYAILPPWSYLRLPRGMAPCCNSRNSIKPLRLAITPTYTYMGRTETDKGWSRGTTCLKELTL